VWPAGPPLDLSNSVQPFVSIMMDDVSMMCRLTTWNESHDVATSRWRTGFVINRQGVRRLYSASSCYVFVYCTIRTNSFISSSPLSFAGLELSSTNSLAFSLTCCCFILLLFCKYCGERTKLIYVEQRHCGQHRRPTFRHLPVLMS
jgi:hypothetical protein